MRAYRVMTSACGIIHLQQKARSLQGEIREREKAEEQLRASLAREQIARAEAEDANRMKDEFLATVSHELRTPLNAIIGWTHMLRGGRLDPSTVARAVETIERNAKSQAQLVEDILDVSRVTTGKLRLNMVTVDVASVINASIDSVQLAAESKNIELEVIWILQHVISSVTSAGCNRSFGIFCRTQSSSRLPEDV